jgi:hypothetical protein
MRQRNSRRSWLLGLFSGLGGLAGLWRERRDIPARTRSALSTSPPVPATAFRRHDLALSVGVSGTINTYDGASRLVSVRHGSLVTAYAYDGTALRPDT